MYPNGKISFYFVYIVKDHKRIQIYHVTDLRNLSVSFSNLLPGKGYTVVVHGINWDTKMRGKISSLDIFTLGGKCTQKQLA